jgi:AraC-like DNA-binding protein
MLFTVVIHSISMLMAVIITLLLILNIRRNPYINGFILLIIISNLIRIPFYLTYSLGWQNLFTDVPKPFNILFLTNTLFFYQYIRLMLQNSRVNFRSLVIPLMIPFVLFLLNLLIPKDSLSQIILRGINFPVIISYVLFFVFLSYKELNHGLWAKTKREFRFSNFKLIRNWLTALFILFVLLAIRLIGSYTYELLTQRMFVNMAFQPLHSVLWIIVYVVFFLNPEILYGLQRVQILPNEMASEMEQIIKPDFKWRTLPKPIKNKMDAQLSIKMDQKINEIIKKLESKTSLRIIVKDPNINLDSLSEKLNIPKSHLQFVFRYYADFTFVAYRSKIRVFHAIAKMQDDFLSKNTMDALARECGFSSYNPFYAAFKAEMGAGPSEVLAKIKP